MDFNVIIVEDQSLPRQFFYNIINGAEGYSVRAAFDSADGVEEFCSGNQVDLILMDVSLGSNGDGLTLARQIKKSHSQIKILVVTQMPEATYLQRAKAIGVDSFWYKDVVGESLLNVIHMTMQGIHVYPDNPPIVKIGLADNTCFTDREMDVLRLMTTGAGDAEIADQLFISYDTVRTHIRHMTEKTGLSRVRLAIEARATGIAIGKSSK